MNALHFAAVQKLFKYQSGRVIALGRVMLAALFLLAIWLDRTQPAQAPTQTYAFLTLYLLFAIAVAAVTWRNWWLDARFALAAHLVDMVMFTAIVFSTNGYTSPFFVFFALPLLSAAIRWGWRETTLTAAALVVLYLTAGLVVTGTEGFEVQRFVIRSGHLVILSALLIWFGIHQRSTRLFFRSDEFEKQLGRGDPREVALRFAMDAAGAKSGLLVLRSSRSQEFTGVRFDDGKALPITLRRLLVRLRLDGGAILFDAGIGCALAATAQGRPQFLRIGDIINMSEAARLGLDEGLIAEVTANDARGWLVLQDVADLSTDYVELGRELGVVVGTIIDRSALLCATEEGAAARTRLTLARDVHDSVVQFLAGAAFRIEAMVRAQRHGADVGRDLEELKRLLVDEQRDIRGFVAALRRDRDLELADAVDELKALAARLGQQWSVKCQVKAQAEEVPIPIRLQLDLQQLLREAVANAVRHGGASRVDVSLAVDGDQLRFDVRDNGSGFVLANGASPIEPWSLKERVDKANGSLMLMSERGRTNISISLPLAGASA